MRLPANPCGSRSGRRRQIRGFALIATLSLMILLTVVAVGLLSLSSISLRSSSRLNDLATARSNARLSLCMALGELQKAAGPDTRVTARADIVDEKNPPILGVWKSWEGTDHDAQGRPVTPDYSNHKKARFVQWLTSASQNAGITSMPETQAGGDRVTLLGAGSVGSQDPAQRQIFLAPTLLSGDSGTFNGGIAWWVGGENQKARLPEPFVPDSGSVASWSGMAKSHSVPDPKPYGLDVVLASADLKDSNAVSDVSKVTSIQQVDLLNAGSSSEKISINHYHDLSANAVGLLTNTATGGWRKDLSLLSETWTSQPTVRLPMFRVLPEKDLLYSRPTSVTSPNSLLYHWTTYRSNPGGQFPGIYQFPAIGSWDNLMNYATFYKTMASTASTMQATAKAIKIDGDAYSFASNLRMLPLIARIQWLYSHQSARYVPKAGEPTNTVRYTLQLLVQPVITLWNPYNVKLTTPGLEFTLNGTLPPVIDYRVDNASLAKRVTLQGANSSGSNNATAYADNSTYRISSQFTLNPGETRVFGAKSAAASVTAGSATIDLIPGFELGRGILADVGARVSPPGSYATSFSGNSKISTNVEFTSEYNDAGAVGVGLYLDMKLAGSTVLAYRSIYDKSNALASYPSIGSAKFPSPTFAQVEGAANSLPFLCVTFGARMASNTYLPSKGFVQSSPFVNYTAMGRKSNTEPTIGYQYPGTLNSVNSPFEFSFQNLTDNSPFIPNVSDTNGFIVTGFNASNGLMRCVINELPGRPLTSLAELQNWDARFENPVPPYSCYLVGNSDASPLFPADAALNPDEVKRKGAENLQHDDSYCLNHVLFDDWFFSSIAPEPANFGRPPTASTSKTVYKELLENPGRVLMNHAYRPISEDLATAASSTALLSQVTKNVGSTATSWKTIASRLEVEGMFNVNSTSVTAWRALLGHARDQRIPYMDSSGNPTLSPETDYAFSRFSVAGDERNSASANGEYAGYRVFTASQLDVLAEGIVDQVRKRGPFLSLAEFINRQLSSNKDLAIAGAVQVALNELSTSGQNPFGVLQTNTSIGGNSNIATGTPPGGDSGYKFADAAIGYNIYGLPGWTRQADVLRSLAPVLSARDDTFTIRAYGDARDVTGKTIKARAVCEATIRRTAAFVDPADDSATGTLSNSSGGIPSMQPVNTRFGRRFEIVSFRWLSADEI